MVALVALNTSSKADTKLEAGGGGKWSRGMKRKGRRGRKHAMEGKWRRVGVKILFRELRLNWA